MVVSPTLGRVTRRSFLRLDEPSAGRNERRSDLRNVQIAALVDSSYYRISLTDEYSPNSARQGCQGGQGKKGARQCPPSSPPPKKRAIRNIRSISVLSQNFIAVFVNKF